MKSNNSLIKTSQKRKWGSRIFVFILILAIFLGLVLMLYPYWENLEHRKQVTQEVTTFKELVSVDQEEIISEDIDCAPERYPKLWAAMQAYNQNIFRSGQAELVDAWSYQSDVFNLSEYGFELDTFALVTIPDISVEMPLYLGASYNNLAKGFAQLSQTSMPIGGKNTNCVIAGHRGWNGMPYMRDVELLEIGDPIYIENPWCTMEYHISEILLIEPNDIETILIQEGRDLVSIITCHPYGVGSHRYVLICERYDENAEATQTSRTWEWHDRVLISSSEEVEFQSSQFTIFVSVFLPWICLLLALLILVITFILFFFTKKKRKKVN